MSYPGFGMSNIFMLSDAKTRSISPENPTGERGGGGRCMPADGSAKAEAAELGLGWKVNPYVIVAPGETHNMADIEGPGIIQHIWITPTGRWRDSILRFYWDDQDIPSVECPVGDFFAAGWGEYAQISSLAVCLNPGSAFNCYWPMPFRERCRVTIENKGMVPVRYYYQIDYALTDIPDNAAYFHAQFRRVNPLPYKEVYTILDGVKGKGRYAGTFMAWQTNSSGWWGEGEIKFYMDGDEEYPTICGTGTEDYFCGSYDFRDPVGRDKYLAFTGPYAGFYPVLADNFYKSQLRFGMYRWHVMDPICFEENLRITIQALGWRGDGLPYLPLKDDIASVAYWYQTLPTVRFPELPDREFLEIN